MEAKELRIGNYVQYETGVVYAVDMIYKEYSLLKVWQPIRLTLDWLFKLNAIREKDNLIVYDRFTLRYLPEYHYWYVMDEDAVTYLTKVEFVHELQNFVYAMNGTELTLKTK